MIKCHNCGIEIVGESHESVLVQINKIQARFHNVFCFYKWETLNKGKYEGGLIA